MEKQDIEVLMELNGKWADLSSDKTTEDNQYNEKQRFYDGGIGQWSGVKWDTMRRQVTDNMCAPIVNTFGALIMGDLPTITSTIKDKISIRTDVAELDEGLAEREKVAYRKSWNQSEAITKIIANFLKKGNSAKELYEGAINASKFGKGVFFIHWNTKTKLPEIQNVYPGYFRCGYKADDMRQLEYAFYTIPMTKRQVETTYPDLDMTEEEFNMIAKEESSLPSGESGIPFTLNKIPKVAVKRYYGPLADKKGIWYVVTVGNKIAREPEKLSYDRVPFIPIKNINEPNDTTGVSDLEYVIPLQEELNRAWSQWSSIVEAESATKVIVPGGKKETMQGLKKQGPMVVPTPRGSDEQPFLLSWNNRTFAMKDRIVSLKREIYEVSGLSEVFLARPDISIVSGVGLTALITPTLQRMKPRIINWTVGLQDMIEICLKMLELKGGKEPTSNRTYKSLIKEHYDIDVQFTDKMPRDETISINNEIMKLQTRLTSRLSAMQRLGTNRPMDEMDQMAFEEYNPFYNREGAVELAQLEQNERRGPGLDQVVSEANRENKVLEQGQQEPVTEELPEEHQVHVETHGSYVEGKEDLPPEAAVIFDAHIAQHEKALRYEGGRPGQGAGGGRPQRSAPSGPIGQAGAQGAPQVQGINQGL